MYRRDVPSEVDDVAPDGSEVRLLHRGERGSQAHFRLQPGQVSAAKRHRTVEELWVCTGGTGEMCVGDETFTVGAGVAVHVPVGTRFQFRATGTAPLDAVAVTMPPWPGDGEAIDAQPVW